MPLGISSHQTVQKVSDRLLNTDKQDNQLAKIFQQSVLQNYYHLRGLYFIIMFLKKTFDDTDTKWLTRKNNKRNYIPFTVVPAIISDY